jgi:hypothetical protein
MESRYLLDDHLINDFSDPYEFRAGGANNF